MEVGNELILSPQTQDEKTDGFPFESLPEEIMEIILIYISTFRSVWRLRCLSKFFFGVIKNQFARRPTVRNMFCPLFYEMTNFLSVKRIALLVRAKIPFLCAGNGIGLGHDDNTPIAITKNASGVKFNNLSLPLGIGWHLIFVNDTLFYASKYGGFRYNLNENAFQESEHEKKNFLCFKEGTKNLNHAKVSEHDDFFFQTAKFVMFFEDYFFEVNYFLNTISFGTRSRDDASGWTFFRLSYTSRSKYVIIKSARRVDNKSCLITRDGSTCLYYEENGSAKCKTIFEGAHACWKNLVVFYEGNCLNLYSFTIERTFDDKVVASCIVEKKYIRTLAENVDMFHTDMNSITLTEFGVYWTSKKNHCYYFFISPLDSNIRNGHEIK